MELLEVNHLCKTYGSGETAVHALKDVSFDWWTGYADFRQGAD